MKNIAHTRNPVSSDKERYRTKSRLSERGRAMFIFVCSVLLLAYLLAPITWLVSSSFQTEAEIVSVPPHWIPEEPTTKNFEAILMLYGRIEFAWEPQHSERTYFFNKLIGRLFIKNNHFIDILD